MDQRRHGDPAGHELGARLDQSDEHAAGEDSDSHHHDATDSLKKKKPKKSSTFLLQINVRNFDGVSLNRALLFNSSRKLFDCVPWHFSYGHNRGWKENLLVVSSSGNSFFDRKGRQENLKKHTLRSHRRRAQFAYFPLA